MKLMFVEMLSADAACGEGLKRTLEKLQPLSPRCLNAALAVSAWLFPLLPFSFAKKRGFSLISLICMRNANKYFHQRQFSFSATDTNHPQTLANMEDFADLNNHH